MATALVITRLMSKVRKSMEDQKLANETLCRSRTKSTSRFGQSSTTAARASDGWLAICPMSTSLEELPGGSYAMGIGGEVMTRIRAFPRKPDIEKTRLDINQIRERRQLKPRGNSFAPSSPLCVGAQTVNLLSCILAAIVL